MVCHFGVGQVLWLTICTAAVGFLPEGETKRKMVHNVLIHCFVFLSSALSAVINYHDIPNRPGKTGICVANHTSPIDVLVLMCDSCYSLVSSMRITCGVIKPSTFFLFFFSLRVFVCLHFPINIPLPPNLFALIWFGLTLSFQNLLFTIHQITFVKKVSKSHLRMKRLLFWIRSCPKWVKLNELNWLTWDVCRLLFSHECFNGFIDHIVRRFIYIFSFTDSIRFILPSKQMEDISVSES